MKTFSPNSKTTAFPNRPRSTVILIRKWAKEFGPKLVATNDVYYINKGDSHALRLSRLHLHAGFVEQSQAHELLGCRNRFCIWRSAAEEMKALLFSRNA